MSKEYLAIDIGASSGRHILGMIKQGKIVLEEIYRFFNGMKLEKPGLSECGICKRLCSKRC